MANDRSFKAFPVQMVLIAALVCTGLGVSSCSTSARLPDGARNALMVYWGSLASDASVEHRIVRAWPGDATEELIAEAPLREVWCVEAEISSAADPSVDGELLVWIVTRTNREARWSAALLASMSSTWPYQACGETPG